MTLSNNSVNANLYCWLTYLSGDLANQLVTHNRFSKIIYNTYFLKLATESAFWWFMLCLKLLGLFTTKPDFCFRTVTSSQIMQKLIVSAKIKLFIFLKDLTDKKDASALDGIEISVILNYIFCGKFKCSLANVICTTLFAGADLTIEVQNWPPQIQNLYQQLENYAHFQEIYEYLQSELKMLKYIFMSHQYTIG